MRNGAPRLLACRVRSSEARQLMEPRRAELIGLHVDSVVFHQNNLFEFARDARDASGAVLAVVFWLRTTWATPWTWPPGNRKPDA